MFVHVYYHHFDKLIQIGAVCLSLPPPSVAWVMWQEAHVNACYKHFYFFIKEFKLIDQKEIDPLVLFVSF